MKTRKLNSTSWAAILSEDQSWELYRRARGNAWDEAARWAMKEYGIEKMPSRTAFYKWLNFMRKGEHAHGIKEGLLAQAMIRDVAKRYKITDDDCVKQLMSAATDAAVLHKDHKLAGELIEMAMAIRDRQQKDIQLKIDEERAKYKGEEVAVLKAKLEMMQKREEALKSAANESEMTEEERTAKIKEILGITQ